MINRLVPAGMILAFGAKKKVVPGEISRVKNIETLPNEKLERMPKADTFTASNKTETKKSGFINAQIPHNGRNKSEEIIKKGNM